MTIAAISSRAVAKVDKKVEYNGKELQNNYGNISYGIFGKAAEISNKDLYWGSNLNQIYKTITGKTDGFGDENRDAYMIQTGIYNAQFVLKK